MDAEPHHRAKPWIQGKTPKSKVGMYTLPQGCSAKRQIIANDRKSVQKFLWVGSAVVVLAENHYRDTENTEVARLCTKVGDIAFLCATSAFSASLRLTNSAITHRRDAENAEVAEKRQETDFSRAGSTA